MRTVHVSTTEIEHVISNVQALSCAHSDCPGEAEPHNPGVTCLRCGALQTMNGWLPEGERHSDISELEEGRDPEGDAKEERER